MSKNIKTEIAIGIIIITGLISGGLILLGSEGLEIYSGDNLVTQFSKKPSESQQGVKTQPEVSGPETSSSIQRKDNAVNASSWLIKKNEIVDFSFSYPRNAKIIDEGNCYRVEYELGFAIFFLPVEGDMRCGARTGVGILPDNVDVTEHLVIMGEEYEAPGFQASVDTKGEKFFNPKKRYFYDFHHMFDLNKNKYCGNASGCGRVGYGIYKETSAPLEKKDIDKTMSILHAIIESVNFNMPNLQ